MAQDLTQYMTAMGPTGGGSARAQGFNAPAGNAGNVLDNLFSNPDFLKFLGQTGAGLDPQGVGGALGAPTARWIERMQGGNAMNQLIKALGGNTNLTKIKAAPDGTLELGGAAPKEGGSRLEELDFGDDSSEDPLSFDTILDNILTKNGVGR